MNERRRERLSAFIQEELGHFFRTELDLPSGALLSIPYVEVIGTGSRANVFVSVYPSEIKDSIAKILKLGENKATHYLRMKLDAKHVPTIRFRVVEDGSVAKW